jgi:UDP-N-acetylmuramoylalanine--D-glutamate ligase
VASYHGVDWYNDSKGTNIGAVIAALKSLGPLYQTIILIAGGDAKGADLNELKPMVCQYVSQLIVMGRDANQFEQVFHRSIPCQRVANLAEAVQVAYNVAKTGDAVLLSPACSSLDMFKNYEERGMLFVKAVKELMDEQQSF